MDENTNVELLGLENPVCSTDDIWRGTNELRCLSDDLDTIEANIASLQSSKADVTHTHSEYASSDHSHDGYATVAALDTLSETVSGKADVSHTHTEYATQTSFNDAVNALETELGGKADTSHSHTEYASTSHLHSEYAESHHSHSDYSLVTHVHDDYITTTSFDELSSTVSGKADSSHSHNGVYDASGSAASALTSANAYTDSKIDALVGEGASETLNTIAEISTAIEDNQYAIDLLNAAITNKANVVDLNSHANDTEIHITESERTTWNAKSNFSGNYNDLTDKPSIPSISGLATETYVDEVASGKANSSHTHDDRYYTETEINTKLSAKADSTHNHNTSYDALGAANTALASAKEYTDDAVADEVMARNSAIATAKSSAISTASSDATTKANNALASAKTYTDTAIETVKNDLLNGAGSTYDTLKELGDLIDDNVDAIEALEAVASGKADASHTHAISDITNLQSTLDGKAASSHGTHVTYSTTVPVMDGTASVGSASTVARSDHKHPTDTSRASQTSLDSHTGNKSNPHGVTLSQLGVTATAAELNALDGITATVTELNYVDGVTSNIQTQLNGKAASSHTHSYAGSSSVGGAATSANKLNTNAGSVTQPVYFANGVPVACTYTLAKSVPADAKFSDTTYGVVTTSANGLMIASDKVKLNSMELATVSEVETYLGI